MGASLGVLALLPGACMYQPLRSVEFVDELFFHEINDARVVALRRVADPDASWTL
jgi:hypothetical protein